MSHLLAGVFAAMTVTASPPDPNAHANASAALVAEENAWHQQRLERLTAEDGWLTLVGLHWLDEGDNRAGSGPDAQVALPASVPATLGTFTRKGTSVRFTPDPGAKGAVTLDGKPFAGGALKTDHDGEPDVLHVGSVQMLVIVRGDRVGVRVRDGASETRRSFQGIDRFPVSAAWRKEARFEPAPKGATISITNVLGQVEETPLAGDVVFTHEGKEFRLEAVEEDGGLFIVFGDQTNKDASYPAGRFLSTDAPKDGRVIVDFNRAYNPPCAFTSFATCPLPTKKNRLPLRVEAGEKRFGNHT